MVVVVVVCVCVCGGGGEVSGRQGGGGVETSCKLFFSQTICMKCQSLFSGINKQNINLLSAKFAQRVYHFYLENNKA